MLRALSVALLLGLLPDAASAQVLGVLHLTITLRNAAGTVVPVARHALLISDNPNTSSPRRILTAADGTAETRLRPGNYTVESDEPLIFEGKSYQWTVTLNITAERAARLELTADNADVSAAPASSTSTLSKEEASSLLMPRWQRSLAAVWTPRARATGFVVDTAGLVVTSQRAIGEESAVEVQLTPSLKVAARVLVADAARDVAILWIDPAATASVMPLALGCADRPRRDAARGQKLVALGLPMRGQPDAAPGEVIRTEPRADVADLRLAPGSAGGPVFDSTGALLGVSSPVDDPDERRRTAKVVPIDAVCETMTSVEKVRQTTPRPIPSHLPIEPPQAIPADALAAAAKSVDGNLTGYQFSSSEFDLAFLTPVVVYHSQHAAQTSSAPQARGAARSVELLQGKRLPVTEFGDWSEYFEEVPPVVVVRVTPKLTEGFWTTVARGAAYTQGMRLPPIKRFKPGFSRLQLFCGDAEVLPIHPFILEQRLSDTDAVREGLYVFDPQAVGPHCQSVKLNLYSEKDPKKRETQVVDPQLVQRVWEDFATYRSAAAGSGARQ
jgi:S1-C subfamily serine protease